jgi:ABC-type lipoprotein release transport system permease subunit
MARTSVAAPRKRGWTLIPPTVTLALWRLGRTWRLLLNAGLGMVAAVMLVCAVPLFSQVATSAGLRDALRGDPFGSGVSVMVRVASLTSATIQQIQGTLDPIIQRDMGGYVSGTPQFSIETQNFPLVTHSKHGNTLSGNGLRLIGADLAAAASRITITQGALPDTSGSGVAVLLSDASAQELGVHPGSRLVLALSGDPTTGPTVTLHVAGIFSLRDPQDAFWHNQDFQPSQGPGAGQFFTALAANDALLAALNANATASGVNQTNQADQPSLVWTYPLDLTRLAGDNLNSIDQQFNNFQIESNDALSSVNGVSGVDIESGIGALASYQVRIFAVQVPITLLLLQVLALALFFVSLMADIVVERQAEAIAVLRSRGASRGQIFGALALQSLGLGLVALILGPLLALVGVRFVAQHALAASDQDALNVIAGDPLAVALTIRWFIVAAVAGAVIAMLIAVNRAVNADVLALRREAARTTRRPLWQRLNLDIAAAVIGVTGYISYTLGVQRLNPQVQTALSPLALIAPFFLLIAAALLFLRVFPLLVQGGAWLAARGRGSAPMLALAQMARAPRQAMRMTLLLALAVAFTIFTFVFSASQQQHTIDAAAFSVGADFSGTLPAISAATAPSLAAQTAQYAQIAGVTAATAGYTASVAGQKTAASLQVNLLAMDADTFAQTAIWSKQNAAQPLPELMARLIAARGDAVANDAVPVIVDDAMWQGFNLASDPRFTLSVPGYTGGAMHLVAIAHIAYIPTIYDSATVPDLGGVLADFTSYAAVFQHDTGAPVVLNTVWLRSRDDAAALASVRAALTRGALRLNNVQDRRAILAAAEADPLHIDLLGVLDIAAATACALGVIGMLIASWLSARSRQTNFAVLRALGGDPRQIGGVLLWEQGIIYAAALTLGIALGAVLASVVLPTLIFTSLITTQNAFFISLNVPPIQTVIPFTPLGFVLGGLALVFIVALALMTRVVTRPSVSQTLRINED